MSNSDSIAAKLDKLTQRQCRVLYWICNGKKVSEIALTLSHAEQTIAWDITRIYDLFGLKGMKDPHQKRRILEEEV